MRRPDPVEGERWRRKAGLRITWRIAHVGTSCGRESVYLIDDLGGKKTIERATLFSKYERVTDASGVPDLLASPAEGQRT